MPLLRVKTLEFHEFIAFTILVCGTILGAIDLFKNGDGQVLAAVITLYGAVLGFVFGRSSRKPEELHYRH